MKDEVDKPDVSVRNRLRTRGRFPVGEAVSIVAQLARSLEMARCGEEVRRAINPDNILLDDDGVPKLGDLGPVRVPNAARLADEKAKGLPVGASAYLAPEQLMGAQHVDVRADVYSLGVVLYEMLAGKFPYEDFSAMELLAKALHGETLPDVRKLRPDVPELVAHVVSLMCSPKPDNRPDTLQAVVALLEKAQGDGRPSPRRPARPVMRHWPIMAWIGVAVVVLIGIFIIVRILTD